MISDDKKERTIKLTDHAKLRAIERGISEDDIKMIINKPVETIYDKYEENFKSYVIVIDKYDNNKTKYIMIIHNDLNLSCKYYYSNGNQ
ncbi:MAG: DUF4258 domain-containing protein [Nitrososphaeraceae archaeon]